MRGRQDLGCLLPEPPRRREVQIDGLVGVNGLLCCSFTDPSTAASAPFAADAWRGGVSEDDQVRVDLRPPCVAPAQLQTTTRVRRSKVSVIALQAELNASCRPGRSKRCDRSQVSGSWSTPARRSQGSPAAAGAHQPVPGPHQIAANVPPGPHQVPGSFLLPPGTHLDNLAQLQQPRQDAPHRGRPAEHRRAVPDALAAPRSPTRSCTGPSRTPSLLTQSPSS